MQQRIAFYNNLSRLSTKQQHRRLWARKPLAYRESACINISVSCPYEISVYSALEHISTTIAECTKSADNVLFESRLLLLHCSDLFGFYFVTISFSVMSC